MALSGCDFKKQNLEKNKLQKDIYTTIKGGKLPPLMVVYKTSNNMALEKIYNKWLSIQPLSEADQKLVKRMVDNGYIARHENGAWRVIATSVV